MSDFLFSSFVIGILIIFVFIFPFMSRISCHSRWKGYQVSYAIIKGCVINENGKNVPEDNFKVIS